jgi:hypothetical protein
MMFHCFGNVSASVNNGPDWIETQYEKGAGRLLALGGVASRPPGLFPDLAHAAAPAAALSASAASGNERTRGIACGFTN